MPKAVLQTLPAPAATHPILMDTDEAARQLSLSPRTLRNWRTRGEGPVYVHAHGPRSTVLYPYDELVAWVDDRIAAEGRGKHARR